MNFYQFYTLLNEYGQNIIQALVAKFQKEDSGLNPDIIKRYIDRFDQIKNNLPERDINKYSWSDLESTVDGYASKERIKTGKLDPTVTDANLLFNKDNIRIYLGKDKKSCIKYGSGYTFCISSRGENNMYKDYRVRRGGTPYFIFNDNLSKDDPRHVLVLFVYKDVSKITSWAVPNKGRYSLTNALNKGEKFYQRINDIISDYPWIVNITNFVDDTKGSVDIAAIEEIEHHMNEEFTSEDYHFNDSLTLYDSSWTVGPYIFDGLHSFVKNCTLKELKDILNNVYSVAVIQMFFPGYGWFDNKDHVLFAYYKTTDDLFNKMKKGASEILSDDFVYKTSDNEIKEKLSKTLNFKHRTPKTSELAEPKEWDEKDDMFGVAGNSSYYDYYFVKVSNAKEFILEFIDQNKETINSFNSYKAKYNKAKNYIKSQNEEKLQEILKLYKKCRFEAELERPYKNCFIVDIINNFVKS